MAQTYAQIQSQIDKLQAEAARLRALETAAIVAQIRKDIETYGITAKDLFGKIAVQPAKRKAKADTAAKYGDGAGNTWVGRGPRPRWLRDALAAGKSLEDFALNAAGALAQSGPQSAPPTSAKPAASKKVAAKKRAKASVSVEPAAA